MADRKQGAGLSSGSSAAVHKAHSVQNIAYIQNNNTLIKDNNIA